jgi:hypothetical protein
MTCLFEKEVFTPKQCLCLAVRLRQKASRDNSWCTTWRDNDDRSKGGHACHDSMKKVERKKLLLLPSFLWSSRRRIDRQRKRGSRFTKPKDTMRQWEYNMKMQEMLLKIPRTLILSHPFCFPWSLIIYTFDVMTMFGFSFLLVLTCSSSHVWLH